MTNNNFVVKAYQPDGDTSRAIEIITCTSVDINWDINNDVTLMAKGASGVPGEIRTFKILNGSSEEYDELIIENMSGKTVQRFTNGK